MLTRLDQMLVLRGCESRRAPSLEAFAHSQRIAGLVQHAVHAVQPPSCLVRGQVSCRVAHDRNAPFAPIPSLALSDSRSRRQAIHDRHVHIDQSGWFVLGVLAKTLVVHMIRRPKRPFVDSRASAPLRAMTLAIVAVGLWLPLGPLAGDFKLQALPNGYFVWLVGILVACCTLTTLMKRIYVRRFVWQ